MKPESNHRISNKLENINKSRLYIKYEQLLKGKIDTILFNSLHVIIVYNLVASQLNKKAEFY